MNAAIGFRAKTGRAITVVLAGTADAPEFIWRGEVSLIDDAYPLTSGPYHHVMDLPWSEALVAVKDLEAQIQSATDRNVAQLVEEMNARKLTVRGVNVVGSPMRSLAKMGNPHIRAHAAEGILFRRVIEVSAAKQKLPCAGFTENELKNVADEIESTLRMLGGVAGPPWRADERLAATAAWIALSTPTTRPTAPAPAASPRTAPRPRGASPPRASRRR